MRKVIVTGIAMMMALTWASAAPADSTATQTKETEQSAASTDEQIANVKGAVDGLNESYLETKATVGALAKIKVSGYIQAQFLVADVKNGALSATYNVPGNAIGKTVYSREAFLIKRGRLKTTYDAGLSQYVLELDATQDGIAVKDAYASFSEPWLKLFKGTIGAMDRPFGYEVGYSSSQLESPERSRIIGNLFPKEKDLGAMIEFAQEDGPMSWLNIKGGFYNGMTNVTDEDDDNKDLIGRVGVKFPFPQAGIDIEGGASGYFGKVTDFDTTGAGTGIAGREFEPTSSGWTMNTGERGQQFKRDYFGVDLQLYYATPVIGGTCIKGEYIQGYHPTKAGAADFYGSGASVTAGNAIYERPISGYYAYLVQNIDPASLQIVLKYDVYDPNTKVVAGDFTTANTAAALGAIALTNQDLAYSTFGFGVLYYLPWAPNIRLQLYYEMPKFEKLDAAKVASGPMFGYTSFSSANNMNLLTFRVQTKF